MYKCGVLMVYCMNNSVSPAASAAMAEKCNLRLPSNDYAYILFMLKKIVVHCCFIIVCTTSIETLYCALYKCN